MRHGLILMALPFVMTGSLLSSCATAPDPAEVCTAEWIKPRTTRAVDDITKSSSSALKSLRKVGETYAAGKTPGPIQLLLFANSMKSLERQVKNGRGIRDLKTLANTCNDPKIVTDTLTGFMRDQGLPDNMIDFVTRTPAYQSIIADIATTDGTPQS
ncbi:MAG: hypothetical protein ABJ275_06275 [Maricaulaceae bacterium]